MKTLMEMLIVASILIIIYLVKDMFNIYVLIISSLILFIVIYNVYIYRTTRSPFVLPLWLFPLAWLLSLIILLFIGKDYALLTYYFTLFLIIGIISKPSIVEKILVPLKNYLIYVFLGIVLLAMIYSPEHKLWVSMGSFIEYFIASYLYVEFTSMAIHNKAMSNKKRLVIVPAGLLFSLLSSLCIFIEPWMVIYSTVVDSLKIFSINTKILVSIILIVDVSIRFLLVGGLQWIIGML